MFKKIKNFFKWIADHIGISWIARKISSGCLVVKKVKQVLRNKAYHSKDNLQVKLLLKKKQELINAFTASLSKFREDLSDLTLRK
ncbi:hypothetical protein OUY_00855 [Wolbachia endosymbiont of Leptopilina clavipes]|uniref:hypothetical protein n=1 Tax=Wolbachia endosymbiont of Leptopilina clavipes TaxID=260213 RepID=UPI00111B0D2D|nr:hypothetical protein [Wolbachia endosymbiont of Leptopilina clavipes]TNK94555.1 hypothetical protein OUY_00855 [Wolbachia endosymbiont of Leptopilina clavipes]